MVFAAPNITVVICYFSSVARYTNVPKEGEYHRKMEQENSRCSIMWRTQETTTVGLEAFPSYLLDGCRKVTSYIGASIRSYTCLKRIVEHHFVHGHTTRYLERYKHSDLCQACASRQIRYLTILLVR